MKLTKYLKGLCVGLATIGILVPNTGVAIGAETQIAAKSSTSVVDVSLVDGGVLQGQVVSPQGQVVANAPVILHQGRTEVAKTTTDKDGRFALKGVKGGVYAVSTNGAVGVVRAWTSRTAPPSSVTSVLLVPQDLTARAQLLGGEGNMGLGTLVLLGLAGTIIAVSIEHNSAS
jgi:hypothetical protein